MKYQGISFKNKDIELDGNEFFECEFDDCTIKYGGGIVILNGCTFTNVKWTFVGAAQQTLQFMTSLYQSEEGGQSLIEETFDNIRRNADIGNSSVH